MNKITGIISAFVLTVGVVGSASAVECEESPMIVGSAIMYLDDASVATKKVSFRSRFAARKALRRAGVAVLSAKAAVAKCGVLPLDSNYLDMLDLDDTVLQRLLGLEVYPADGNVSVEAALSLASTLTAVALKETYGPVDVDAVWKIKAAMALLERVEMELLD